MRIGIFGGTFDPPHHGHLLAALDAMEALDLDRLQVVPAAVQPLKPDTRTAGNHRLAMTQRCFEGMPRVEVDPIEMERGGLSFTVDTVEAYRRRWPSAELHLLIGEDAMAGLARWREPERLLSMVRLVVLARTIPVGTVSEPTRIGAADSPVHDQWMTEPPNRLALRRVDVSSTEIRARVKKGLTLRGFVPEAVAAYIASNSLYLQATAALGDPTPD